MSLRATSWAWTVQTNPTAKLVLVALADHADETGLCWPSLSRLREFTGLSERAIRDALRVLENGLIIVTDQREGRPSRYILRINSRAEPRQEMPGSEMPTPAFGAGDPGTICRTPRHDVPETPAPRAPEPSRTVNEPPRNLEVVARSPSGSRLPAGWMPSDTDADFAAGLGLDADAVAETFRDYWAAQPGAKGRKTDWPATWRNWCRRDAQRQPAPRQQREGKLAWLIRDMEQNP